MKFSDKLVVLFCTSWAALDTNLSHTMSTDHRRPGGIPSSDSVKSQYAVLWLQICILTVISLFCCLTEGATAVTVVTKTVV